MVNLQRKMSNTKEDRFKKDIEKYPLNFDGEDESNKERRFSLIWKIILCFVGIWLVVEFVGIDMKEVCMKNMGKNHKDEIEVPSANDFKTKTGTFHSDINLVDVNTITANNEYEKLSMGQPEKQNTKGSNTQALESEVDPQNDLKEIFSVSPLIIFSKSEKSEKQKELENIFLLELNIVPEPKVVDLTKHPRHTQIIEYLTSYSTHEQNLATSHSSDVDYEQDSKSEVDNIPRVFLGGVPIGNCKDIVRKFDDNELLGYLREIGHGLISVS